MKKQKLLPMIGCLALATAVYFNVRHALNDYGVRDNEKLHPQILAQANTTGNSSGKGSGSTGNGSGSGGFNSWYEWISQGLTKDERELQVACQGTLTKTVNGQIQVFVDGVWVTLNIGSTTTYPSGTIKITCPYGNVNCTPTDC